MNIEKKLSEYGALYLYYNRANRRLSRKGFYDEAAKKCKELANQYFTCFHLYKELQTEINRFQNV